MVNTSPYRRAHPSKKSTGRRHQWISYAIGGHGSPGGNRGAVARWTRPAVADSTARVLSRSTSPAAERNANAAIRPGGRARRFCARQRMGLASSAFKHRTGLLPREYASQPN